MCRAVSIDRSRRSWSRRTFIILVILVAGETRLFWGLSNSLPELSHPCPSCNSTKSNPIQSNRPNHPPLAGDDEVVSANSPEQPDGDFLPQGRPQRRRGRPGRSDAASRERDEAVLPLRGGQGGEEGLPGEEKTRVQKAAQLQVVTRPNPTAVFCWAWVAYIRFWGVGDAAGFLCNFLGSIYKFSLSGERRNVAEKLGSLRRFANMPTYGIKHGIGLPAGGGSEVGVKVHAAKPPTLFSPAYNVTFFA